MTQIMTVAETLYRILEQSGQTIAVAESLTSGWVQTIIGSVPGASKVFSGGMTAYTLNQKVAHLGVNRSHAETVDAVSERVAEEMAQGVRALFRSSIGLSTTGYAEPSLDQGVDYPFAYVAADILGRSWVWRVDGAGGARTQVQRHVAEQTVLHLMDALQSLASQDTMPGDVGCLQQAVREV